MARRLTALEGENDDSSMLIRRAEDADEDALASIRRSAILALTGPDARTIVGR